MYNKHKFDGRYIVIQHDGEIPSPEVVDTIEEAMELVGLYGSKGEDYIICELTARADVGVGVPKAWTKKAK